MKAIVVGPFDDHAFAALARVLDVVRVPGITFESVAPHMKDAEVLVTRRLVVKAALFDIAPHLRLIVIHGKTLGVVGVGHVGSRVARLGRTLEMTVIGCDPYIDPATSAAPLTSYDDLLARSDVVSFHVPLTEETRGMIDARALSLVRPGATVINMSRGEIAGDAAIIAALDTGRLAGYAADVLPHEVPGMTITSPLLDHPQVLLTPHLGAWAAETDRRVCMAAVAVVEQWVAATAHAGC